MISTKRVALSALFISLLVVFGGSQSAMAAGLEDSIEFQKGLATSLSACYAKGAFKDEITLASYGSGGVSSIMSSTSTNMTVPVPSTYTAASAQLPSMSCSTVLSKALSKKGISLPANFESAESALTTLGYTKVVSRDLDNDKTCFWFEYDVNVEDSQATFNTGVYTTRDEVWKSKQICLTEYTDNGTLMTRLDGVNADNGGNDKILKIQRVDNTSVIKFQTQSLWVNDDWVSLDTHRGGTAADFMLTMYNSIISTAHGRTGSGEVGSGVNTYTLKGYQDQNTPISSDTVNTRYVIQAGAARTVPENLFGVTRYFNQANTFVLYQNYLMRYYEAMTLEVDPNDPTQESLRTGNDRDLGGYSKVKVYSNGAVKECYVKPKKTSGKLYGVSNNYFGGIDSSSWQYPSPIFQVGYDEIVNFLNGNTPLASELSARSSDIIDANCAEDNQQEQTSPSNPGGSGSTTSNDSDSDGDGNSVSNCIDAAGALGWIICPVLKMAGETAEKLYGYIDNNFLWIGSDVMETGKATHQAWGIFRNYANVAFIIMFLVVILSQITGFGISNYGIKKILPRLIAVALLTNLSFIICQLAVDVSDIVGSGIKTLLGNFSVAGTVPREYGVNNFISDIFGVLFASIGTVGAGYLAAVTWDIWLPPLLLAVIVAIVGVFVFFLSLAVRQAGVVILVVLCPVAIICYALPNTKKLFDKWLKMFTSLLMVYPICGLLMGGGQFASSVLVTLADDGNPKFMLTLTAMLLSVIPFFFIPTIVRTSLNAIGQLGARLSNFGRGLGRGLSGMARNSERFKDWQHELGARHDEATVRRLDARALRRREKGKEEYTASGRRRRLRAYMRADKARREELLGQAYEGRDLLSDDPQKQKQLLGNLTAKDFDERVTGAKAAYRDDPRMAAEKNIVAEHDRLLNEFGNDPNNIRLQSQLRALEEMAMEKGAPGQDMLQQSFAKYMTENKNSLNDDKRKALSKLGAGMATRFGKDLNGSDKGFNTMMNHFSEGNFDKNLDSFHSTDIRDRNGNVIGKNYFSNYDTKLAGFTAAGMGKATPGALKRGYEALQSGRMEADDALTLTGNATQAINDEIISKDLKPEEKGFVQNIVGYGAAATINSLEQGTLESISRFVGSTNDTEALSQLGLNIQGAASNGHAYSEEETKTIGRILNQINSKVGTNYEFNPASVRVDQSGQQQAPDVFDDPVMQEYQQAQQATSDEYIPPSTAMADEDFRRDIGRG